MSRPSLLRKEMESKRQVLKDKLNGVEVDLVQIDDSHFRVEQYQNLKSIKRLLIKEINNLTVGIKNLKEIEVDESVVDEMDDTFKKLESGEINIDDIKNMIDKMDNVEDTDKENYVVEWDTTEEEEKPPEKPEEEKKVSDEDISSAVDDLLDNL